MKCFLNMNMIIDYILLKEITAAQSGVALSYHNVYAENIFCELFSRRL